MTSPGMLNPFFARFGTQNPIVLPVIHVETADQALRNAEIAQKADCAGVFLINHSIGWRKLLEIAHNVNVAFPKLWLGVNCLDLAPEEVFNRVNHTISGIWVDNAKVLEHASLQDAADRILEARHASGWQGLYFGGVAFKYQREVRDLEAAASTASRYMEVVTTSGPGTGQSASREKIAALRRGLGEGPLAIASGITPENVTQYLDLANCFLVATGISRSFTELDRDRLATLLRAVREPRPVVPETGATPAGLLASPFTLPPIDNRNVLVVGVGGGCDIISAYAIAKLLAPQNRGTLIYANTKRSVGSNLENLAPNVFRVAPGVTNATDRVPAGYGSTWIDETVPRSTDGCPLIFRLPNGPAEEVSFVSGLQARYEFDLIISVDTGADSIVPNALSGQDGRDREMLRILREFPCERLHLTVAPGCDGESTGPDILRAVIDLQKSGKYLGCFPVKALLPVYANWSRILSPDRTPNIILNAMAGTLEKRGDSIRIPRGRHPLVPAAWLTQILAFR